MQMNIISSYAFILIEGGQNLREQVLCQEEFFNLESSNPVSLFSANEEPSPQMQYWLSYSMMVEVSGSQTPKLVL